MLPAKYIAFLLFMFLIFGTFSVIYAGNTVGEGELETIKKLTAYTELTVTDVLTVYPVVGATLDTFSGIYEILTMKASYAEGGEWQLLWWFLWMPIVALAVYGLIMTLVGIFNRSI